MRKNERGISALPWRPMARMFVTLIVAACSDGSTAPPPSGADGLQVTPRAVTLDQIGSSVTLQASVGGTLSTDVLWDSSDSFVVVVDAQGVVTAVRPGKAWIRARSGGLGDSVRVHVDLSWEWAAVGDWGTASGDNGHSGFLPVTLNRKHFRFAWASQPFDDSPVQAVAAGEGSVFMTNFARFGPQRVAALDLTTGTITWMRDLGTFYAIGQPVARTSRLALLFGSGTYTA